MNQAVKNIAVLGSTGSIGRSTLAVVEMFPARFSVRALTARYNVRLLAEQVQRFQPELAVVYDEASAVELEKLLPGSTGVEIMSGEAGYRAAAEMNSVDTVVSAMVGAAGLLPTLAAVRTGKDIALANKETLVMAGDLVMQEALCSSSQIRPVDSEHSAIFQCICGNRREDLEKLILTASGGPFRNLPKKDFSSVTPEDALAHPTWQMGAKITIDSATLMNKGFEVIEAAHLFSVPSSCIEVVIHPQSIVHSMVSYRDGSVIAQMGVPDMKAAIAYSLSGPERLSMKIPSPDFADISKLTFEAPDTEKFPCLCLAARACESGGTLPAVLNAANEVAVEAFLKRKISFTQIPELIEHALESHGAGAADGIEQILEADRNARKTGLQWVEAHGRAA